jgi:hypothetical protein
MEERRRAPRRSFPVVRRIAEAAGEEVPEQADFFSVQCRDISTHGFSFLVKTRPRFQSLVLALEASPNPVYVTAEVRHRTEVLVHPSGRVEVVYNQGTRADRERPSAEGAESWVLVGCEFTRRVPPPGNQESAPG